ncbi:MAG: sugar phosphate isomerase/epimerase [Clostridia bacterium]|nr:sugar phosphate isomerase/epimerase [Clostridia bacterium]MBQ9995520.1 sugar phosphate isomerase/epimerase [Clostridia bacterium]
MALPVAVQVYSVRDSAEANLADTLRKIKEMGYDGVEFAGLYGYAPEYIKGLIDALELIPVSAHIPLDEMIADPEGTFAAYQTIGVKFAAVPYVTPERRPGAEKFEETIEVIAKLGETAKKYGITLLYHNHDFEFTKVDGEYGLDILYKRVPKEFLETELDTCWVNVGGEVPAEYIAKYNGRTPVVHLKDFYMSGKLPKHLYALIGIDEEEKDDEPSTFEFRPVGHGMQDMPAILEASVASGAQYVVVEQDEPSMGLSRMECIKASREYLKSIGW